MKNIILSELKLRSTDWASISDRYLDRDAVTITRGKSDAASQARPSTCNVTYKNVDGALAPRNPNSPISGQFGKNTPHRLSVVRERDAGAYGLVLMKGSNGRASVNDNPAVSVTGDIDVRLDLELLGERWTGDPHTDWTWPLAGFDLANKWTNLNGTRSWSFIIIAGKPWFSWSSDGTSTLAAQSTAALAGPNNDRRVLRATLDVDNGAGGNTTTFYTGPTLAGPWTQLGAPIIKAGTTSIYDSTTPMRVGSAASADAFTWGRSGPVVCYGFELRSGIGGTVVASADFTAQILDPNPWGDGPGSDGTWFDDQGNLWIPSGSADAARIWYGKVWTRHVGEVAELPPRWDPSHSDKYVPIVANGILRRLAQGKAPIRSGLREYILSPDLVDALAFYVPLSGEAGTIYSLNLAPANPYYLKTRFYPWFNGIDNVVYTYGRDMGAAWIGDGMEFNASGTSAMLGDPATADQNVAFDCVWSSPSLGVFTVQIEDYSGMLWNLVLDTPDNDGTLQVSFDDPAVGPIGFAEQGPFTELQDNNLHHLRFQLTKDGSDTDFAVYIDGTLRSSGTMAGYVLNGWARFSLYYSRYVNQTVMNLAHIACWANADAGQIPPIADTVAAAFGYVGETAGERMTRLCDEGGIPLQIVGDPATTTVMGPQFAEPRMNAIRDAEQTDFGILTEQRDDLGLLYRTRASQYAQDPAVTIDYSAKVVAPPFEPVDDDAETRNDVTASRRDGGSYQLQVTSGPMSVQDPPFGIGQYDDEVTVNVATDAQLPGAAAWWLNLGTIDAARFPSVTFNLHSSEIADELCDLLLGLEVGDRLPITNIEAADIPDDLDLIVQGYSETITNKTWTITFVCAPGAPYQVAKYDSARYDVAGSVLTAAIDANDTSFQVSKTGTSIWTRTPAAFPFDINVGGERMTVGGITSDTSPQTFDPVTRGVNGVVKSHGAGATVRLWDTPRYAY